MPERPMSQMIFGSPQVRRPNGNSFRFGEILPKIFRVLMALFKQVEDDGLQRLYSHRSFLSCFAFRNDYSLVRVSHEMRTNLIRIVVP